MTRMVQARSQYAVILAWCGDHRGAIAELERLDPYLDGLEEWQRLEIEGQTALIANIISEAMRVADRQRCRCGTE